MAKVAARWTLTGTVLIACNCDWGCPCNFNALPTQMALLADALRAKAEADAPAAAPEAAASAAEAAE